MICLMKRFIILIFGTVIPMCAAPYTPQMILQDGADFSISTNPYTQESGEVRKGTVAATLNNIAKLNSLLQEEGTPEQEKEIKAIVEAIDQLIPSLQIIGMFDLFEPVHWFGQREQMGRIVALALYFKHYPERDKWGLKQQMRALEISVSSPTILALFKS